MHKDLKKLKDPEVLARVSGGAAETDNGTFSSYIAVNIEGKEITFYSDAEFETREGAAKFSESVFEMLTSKENVMMANH